MFTCCLHCQTCFRVTEAQLKVAQGKVRCGKCHQVFNAKLSLHEQDPTAAQDNSEKQVSVTQTETQVATPAQTPVRESASHASKEPLTEAASESNHDIRPSTPSYQRDDHEHFSLSTADAGDGGIDAIFDALDEQLTSGIFEDILPRDTNPPPVEPDDIDVNKLLDEQLASLQKNAAAQTKVNKTDDIVLDLYDAENIVEQEKVDSEYLLDDNDITGHQTDAESTDYINQKIDVPNTSPDAKTDSDELDTFDTFAAIESPQSSPPDIDPDIHSSQSDDHVESSFFDKLREKTTAESQQLELGIGDLKISHPNEKNTKASNPDDLKQAIDSIIQINTGPEDAPADDSIAGAEHASIMVPKIDLGTARATETSPEKSQQKDPSLSDASSTSLDDAINDAFGFAEEADDVKLQNKIKAAAEQETEIEINNDYQLQPLEEATEAVAALDTKVTDTTDIWPDSKINSGSLPIGAHFESADDVNLDDNDQQDELGNPEDHDEWDAVLDVSKISIPDPEAVDPNLPGANNEDIVIESDSFDLPDNNEHAVPLSLRDSIDSIHEPEVSMKQRAFKSIAIVALTVTLLLQVVIFKSTELIQQWPGLRNNIASWCEALPCRYTGKHDLKKISMLSRDIRVHPKNKGALLITAAMANQAGFAQPYPDILLRFTDLTGEVIAQRRFNPQEYLGNIYQPFILMPAKTPVHLTFAVLDPGSDAINFEFDFL